MSKPKPRVNGVVRLELLLLGDDGESVGLITIVHEVELLIELRARRQPVIFMGALESRVEWVFGVNRLGNDHFEGFEFDWGSIDARHDVFLAVDTLDFGEVVLGDDDNGPDDFSHGLTFRLGSHYMRCISRESQKNKSM
jgi:hypothetical protein